MTSPSKWKGKHPMIDTAIAGEESGKKNYERMFSATKEQVEKASASAFKTYEDLSKFSKENLEAYVAAGTTVAKGFESIGRAWVNFTQETFEASAQAAKALRSAKPLREAVDVETDLPE